VATRFSPWMEYENVNFPAVTVFCKDFTLSVAAKMLAENKNAVITASVILFVMRLFLSFKIRSFNPRPVEDYMCDDTCK
jgi:hypothetical protein